MPQGLCTCHSLSSAQRSPCSFCNRQPKCYYLYSGKNAIISLVPIKLLFVPMSSLGSELMGISSM